MKDLIEKYNFNFKKKFGQNFLKDKNILENIALKSDIDKDTLVIEIGVGAAALTNVTCNYAKNVIGYEIDETLKPIINEVLGDKDNVEIIFTDFLKRNVNEVANLPYYITTPIIEKIIEDDLGVDKIVIMVQKEVGDRFNAKVGTKDYNSLTVFLNYYFDIKKLMNVSRNSFVPAPNVDSVIIEMDKKKNNYAVQNEKLFFNIIRDSFKFKRKNLRNNLKGYNLDKILEVLKEYDLDLTVRAENLTIEQFIEISNKLNEE